MKTKDSHASQPMGTRIIKVDDRKEINNKIGYFIKDLRESRGISQHDLGTAIGLSEDIAQQHIYKYEHSIIRIPIDIAFKIAKRLNVDIIVNGDNMIFIPR